MTVAGVVPMIRWKRSTGDFVESHCGRWNIAPIYGGLTRPESYVLYRDGKAVGSGSTQREAKDAAAARFLEVE